MVLSWLLLLALAEAVVGTIPNYTEHTFTQVVDHFGISNTDTFQQRYLVTEKYWKKDTSHALLFYTGNEGPIDQFWDNTGFIFEAAEQLDALVIFGEHRYYGESLPYGNSSFDAGKVHYLMMEQAIADYAVMIQHLRQQYKFTKVVVFGGSYGGQLSTYMRFKYPFIVDGAIAASAPIFQVAGIVPGELFWNGVTEACNKYNSACPDKIREAFSKILDLKTKNASGWADISKAFNLCDPLNSTADVDYLIGWIMNAFASLAMINYPYPTNFLAPVPAYPIHVACEYMLNTSDVMVALQKAVGIFYNGNSGKCFKIHEDYVECADPTGCGTGNEAKAWDYQSCTELMMDSSTNNKTDMFPRHIFNSTSYCRKTWGVERRIGWPSVEFWGKEIFTASNIFFSNGDLDPWGQGGVTKSDNPTIIAYLIKDGAHHLDLRSSNKLDPESVTKARKEEVEWIQKWISP